MRAIVLILLAAVLAAIGCANDPLNAYTEAQGYEKVLAVAKQENKRLFIDFSAGWCGPCRVFKKKTLHDPAVVEALRKYVVLLVDVDNSPELARNFGVGGIPHFCVVDADGRKLQEGSGALGVAEFLAWLQDSERRPGGAR
jgi:thiol:disulfide interchange protein